MARPVSCRVVDIPNGSFGVVAVIDDGKVFHRAGLLTLAEAEEHVEGLHSLMAACGASVTREYAAEAARTRWRKGQADRRP